MTYKSEDSLTHYGIARRSGRYPWGSGEDPRAGRMSFLDKYEELKGKGLKETEIAEQLGMNTSQLRNNITWARKEQRAELMTQIGALKEAGFNNTVIANKLNTSEATVRNYLNGSQKNDQLRHENILKALTEGVDQTGYLDVGVGVERQLGISRTRFNAMVNKLAEEEGYYIHEIYVKRLSDPSKYTTVKVLTKEENRDLVNQNSEKIQSLTAHSDDSGRNISQLRPPLMIDLDRIKIRYAEDGGADKDGLIELRPGAKDLDLGASKYAQVRIGAGENLYLKGMAAYSYDDFPKGVDIIFNTNKSKDVPKEKVLKKMTDDPNNPFGATIKPRGQKGHLNIVNEQGDWDTWSKKMSSQFLSKQPVSFIKDRLSATAKAIKMEFDEINGLTNPVVKQHLLKSYIEGLATKASHLKAQGLPRTKNHVLLPITDIKPNEIFAPLYKNGETVVLVRHPHGGIFEIPELVVNNKNATGRKMIGDYSPDAVGIHPSVAEKLSGADFDGDTALVIPNGKGQIKTARSLKELKGWADEMHTLYKRDHPTIKPETKQIQMGIVSNLITDMSIKGATDSEKARAVKHSMVVIDSEKHNLDYKQSAKDNGISALRKKYQTHIDPETGKVSSGASTLISLSKRKIDIEQPDKARAQFNKGKTPSEIAKNLNVNEDTILGYLNRGEGFNPDKYSSGRAVENEYSKYIKEIQSIRSDALKVSASIQRPAYSKEAAKVYAPELNSLNEKLNQALLNSPLERQAQLLTNNMYYTSVTSTMSKDEKKKLKARALATSRDAVGAKKSDIKITDKEWEAIQARAVSSSKLDQILNNADMDIVRKLAAPKAVKMDTAKATRARALLNNGYTYAEVAEALGVSTTTIRNIVN